MAPPTSNTSLATTQNINDLAAVMHAEARGAGTIAQTAVGFTIVNRMKRNNVTRVRAAWHGFAHRSTHQAQELALAKAILEGTEPDISQGATHFYSPNAMPHEGGSIKGMDVSGGLESTEGVKGKTYRPSWAISFTPISISGIPPKVFKFYKAPGDGRVH